jgi:hypothetical protein
MANLTQEALKLSRAFGITTTQGSVLAVALGDIFQSSDVALTANKARILRMPAKLTKKQIEAGRAALAAVKPTPST